MTSNGGIVESLLLHVDKGEGLLLRLYRLNKDLREDGSDLAFLREQKPFPSLLKSLRNVSKGLASYQPTSKQQEELVKMWPKIRKHLTIPFETLVDVKLFLESVLLVFDRCNELHLDTSATADLTKLYLDLVSLFASIFIMTSRIEARKIICVVTRASEEHGKPNRLGDTEYKSLCDFISLALAKPLLTAHVIFKPFRQTLRSALLSSACMAFARQMQNSEQWQKEEFLSFESLVPEDGTDTDLESCLGYSIGVETIDIRRMEKWLFYGFLFCHSAIDVNNKGCGEYRLWSMLLQSMWVLPIIRDEVLLVHEELAYFFKSIKSSKLESGAAKKLPDMKLIHATALRSAPPYRQQRRLHLYALLSPCYALLKEQPALLGPRALHITKLLSLCRAELDWLTRHQSHMPTRKQDIGLVQPDALRRGDDCLSLVHHVQQVRHLAISNCATSIQPYMTALVTTLDVPALRELLAEELARINDTDIEHHPIHLAIAALNAVMEKTSEDKTKDEMTSAVVKGLKMDLLRLQAHLSSEMHASTGKRASVGKSRSPSPALICQLDTTLVHLDLVLSCVYITDGEEEDVLTRRAAHNVGFLACSDLSFLPLAYPKLMHAHFSHALASAPEFAVAMVEVAAHPGDMNPLCPEDIDAVFARDRDVCASLLTQSCQKLMQHFRRWSDFQWSMLRQTLPGAEAAARLALQTASKRAKAGGSTADLEKIVHVKQQQLQIAKRHQRPVDGALYDKMTCLCRAISERNVIHVFGVSFAPAQFVLRALEADFVAFCSSLLSNQLKDFGLGENVPSLAQIRVQHYIWCSLSLFSQVTTSPWDEAEISMGFMTKLRDFHLTKVDQSRANAKNARSIAEQYLYGFFCRVVQPIAEMEDDSVHFSREQRAFVPLIRDKQKKKKQQSADSDLQQKSQSVENTGAERVAASLSPEILQCLTSYSELRALAGLFGAEGITWLVQDLIVGDRALAELVRMKEASASNCYEEVLNRGVKAGSYFVIRDLLMDALDGESAEKMPFLMAAIDNVTLNLGRGKGLRHCAAEALTFHLLKKNACEKRLFCRADLDVLLASLACAIAWKESVSHNQLVLLAITVERIIQPFIWMGAHDGEDNAGNDAENAAVKFISDLSTEALKQQHQEEDILERVRILSMVLIEESSFLTVDSLRRRNLWFSTPISSLGQNGYTAKKSQHRKATRTTGGEVDVEQDCKQVYSI